MEKEKSNGRGVASKSQNRIVEDTEKHEMQKYVPDNDPEEHSMWKDSAR